MGKIRRIIAISARNKLLVTAYNFGYCIKTVLLIINTDRIEHTINDVIIRILIIFGVQLRLFCTNNLIFVLQSRITRNDEIMLMNNSIGKFLSISKLKSQSKHEHNNRLEKNNIMSMDNIDNIDVFLALIFKRIISNIIATKAQRTRSFVSSILTKNPKK